MGHCEYVDDSKPWTDGYYCTILGGKVPYDLTRCYCRYESDCRHCPVRGGDDRFRRKPEPEPDPEPQPVISFDEAAVYYSSYSPSTSTTTTTSTSTHSSGGGGGGSSLFDGCLIKIAVVCIIVMVAVVWIMVKMGYNRPLGHVMLMPPESVEHSEIRSQAISHDPAEKYTANDWKLRGNGEAMAYLSKGRNSFHIMYDNAKVMVGVVECDGSSDMKREYSFEDLNNDMLRALTMELTDGRGDPVDTEQVALRVEGAEDYFWAPGGPGQLILCVDNACTSVQVCIEAEGYEPLQLQADLTERLVGMKVTIVRTKGGGGT